MRDEFGRPYRRSIRLTKYNYSMTGAYFVTICAWQREHIFGRVVAGQTRLNQNGTIVSDCWHELSNKFKTVILDEMVIMPNHFHGIVWIDSPVGATQRVARQSSTNDRARRCLAPTANGPKPGSLGAIIGQFKSLATKRINVVRHTPHFPVWQRNYYERVIRDDRELAEIRQYILDNPYHWDNGPGNIL